MRILLVVLVLVNLAFFGWTRWIDVPAEAVPARAPDAAVPLLQLDPGALAQVPTRCRTIGPFADAASANTAAGVLRGRGVQPHDRIAQGTAADGYWVYITDLNSSADQRRALTKLQDAGLHDAAVMTQADQAGRVSVGIFADQSHAVRRAEQVRVLGFKPVLELHQRDVDQHWLDVNLRVADPDPSLTDLSGATSGGSDSNAGPSIADCPAKAAGG